MKEQKIEKGAFPSAAKRSEKHPEPSTTSKRSQVMKNYTILHLKVNLNLRWEAPISPVVPCPPVAFALEWNRDSSLNKGGNHVYS